MSETSLFNGKTLLVIERTPGVANTRLNVLNGHLEPMAENDIVDESTGQIVGTAESLAVIVDSKHVAQLMRFQIDGRVDCRLTVNPSVNIHLIVLCLN